MLCLRSFLALVSNVSHHLGIVKSPKSAADRCPPPGGGHGRSCRPPRRIFDAECISCTVYYDTSFFFRFAWCRRWLVDGKREMRMGISERRRIQKGNYELLKFYTSQMPTPRSRDLSRTTYKLELCVHTVGKDEYAHWHLVLNVSFSLVKTYNFNNIYEIYYFLQLYCTKHKVPRISKLDYRVHTVGKSYFMHNVPHFSLLFKYLLPFDLMFVTTFLK